jgi:hypothetical protein
VINSVTLNADHQQTIQNVIGFLFAFCCNMMEILTPKKDRQVKEQLIDIDR